MSCFSCYKGSIIYKWIIFWLNYLYIIFFSSYPKSFPRHDQSVHYIGMKCFNCLLQGIPNAWNKVFRALETKCSTALNKVFSHRKQSVQPHELSRSTAWKDQFDCTKELVYPNSIFPIELKRDENMISCDEKHLIMQL